MMKLEIVYLDPHELTPYENNTRKHSPEDIEQIKASIQADGFNDPIGVWGENNLIVEGHGRQIAALEMGLDKVPCIRLDHMTETQRRDYAIRHNRTAELSGWDFAKLEEEIAALEIEGVDLSGLKFDFDGNYGVGQTENDSPSAAEPQVKLSDKFVIPPFSVLDTRQGYWGNRKRAWKEKIKERGQARQVQIISKSLQKYNNEHYEDASILDPVLSEIMLKWFAPENGDVFDVFAGDTVFGYVSGYLGYNFTGIELREEQCHFNREACNGLPAQYICDDGRNVNNHIEPESQDMFFSCPPYFDLEVYSDLENDASNQKTYAEFYRIIDTAFSNAIKCLKDNRFAVVVCGDIRNKKTGEYYRFPDDIKATFQKNGMLFYNELILVDNIGTARLRATKYMEVRKVAKTHQNVLVFYKGDTRKIKAEFPIIEVQDGSEDMEF